MIIIISSSSSSSNSSSSSSDGSSRSSRSSRSIELTHSKTILENTVEIERQVVALDFKNLSEYSSRSN